MALPGGGAAPRIGGPAGESLAPFLDATFPAGPGAAFAVRCGGVVALCWQARAALAEAVALLGLLRQEQAYDIKVSRRTKAKEEAYDIKVSRRARAKEEAYDIKVSRTRAKEEEEEEEEEEAGHCRCTFFFSSAPPLLLSLASLFLGYSDAGGRAGGAQHQYPRAS